MMDLSNTCSIRTCSRLRLEIEQIFESSNRQLKLTWPKSSTRIDVVSKCLPDRLGLKMRDLLYEELGPLDKWGQWDRAKLDIYITATHIADRAVSGRLPYPDDVSAYLAAREEEERLKPICFPNVYGGRA